MARPQRLHPRRRAHFSHLHDQRPRRRGDGHGVELSRHDGDGTSGGVGRFARRLPANPAVQMVELERQLRARRRARPATGDNDHAAAIGAADFLYLAAAPTFAIMALLTGVFGGGPADALCSIAGASPLAGMVPMYLLMSAFHLAPWLRLIAGRGGTRAK